MSEDCELSTGTKILTAEESEQLERQNSRLVSEFKANQLELDARKNWDLFYKRNDTRFFRDRHWTVREFEELLSDVDANAENKSTSSVTKRLLEVGCGVGNFVFPLIEEKHNSNYYIYACDFSQRAIDFVKQNELYDESIIQAFQCDVTTNTIFETIEPNSLDIVSLIFVLSAIHPTKFNAVLANLFKLLKPGGILLFRDYGLYDMAQIRFKAGNKIANKLYMRQDGTRSYYFSVEEISDLVETVGYDIISNVYVHRKTINIKENVDKDRIFLQGKFSKPITYTVDSNN